MDLNTSEFLATFLENIGTCTSTPIPKVPDSCGHIKNCNSPTRTRKRKLTQTTYESELDIKAKRFNKQVVPTSSSSDSSIEASSSSVIIIDDTIKCQSPLISSDNRKAKASIIVNDSSDETLKNVNETLITVSETYCTDATLTSQLSDVSSLPIDFDDSIFAPASQELNDNEVLLVNETPGNQNDKESNQGYRIHDNIKPNRQIDIAYNDSHYQRPSYTLAEAELKGPKRMVIIDGSNVAFTHSSQRKEFSVKGIDICINYFLERGYEVKAVVPQMRLKRSKSTNSYLLEQLKDEGKLIITPCKSLPNGASVTSYDDRFILDIAHENDAVVISNDNYRDLFNENENYKAVIQNRVIGYTFCNDLILFPVDPYGKNGPTLDNILTRKGY